MIGGLVVLLWVLVIVSALLVAELGFLGLALVGCILGLLGWAVHREGTRYRP